MLLWRTTALLSDPCCVGRRIEQVEHVGVGLGWGRRACLLLAVVIQPLTTVPTPYRDTSKTMGRS